MVNDNDQEPAPNHHRKQNCVDLIELDNFLREELNCITCSDDATLVKTEAASKEWNNRNISISSIGHEKVSVITRSYWRSYAILCHRCCMHHQIPTSKQMPMGSFERQLVYRYISEQHYTNRMGLASCLTDWTHYLEASSYILYLSSSY